MLRGNGNLRQRHPGVLGRLEPRVGIKILDVHHHEFLARLETRGVGRGLTLIVHLLVR